MPPGRIAPMNVAVFHEPQGREAQQRSPRGDRPLSQAILAPGPRFVQENNTLRVEPPRIEDPTCIQLPRRRFRRMPFDIPIESAHKGDSAWLRSQCLQTCPPHRDSQPAQISSNPRIGVQDKPRRHPVHRTIPSSIRMPTLAAEDSRSQNSDEKEISRFKKGVVDVQQCDRFVIAAP